MIRHARFQNFEALREVEVTFDSRLTVLVGPNGCGKTSVLQGLHFLTQLGISPHQDTDFTVSVLHEYVTVDSRLEDLSLDLNGDRSGRAAFAIELNSDDSNQLSCRRTAVIADREAAWRSVAGRSNE
jgi:recombinational DNA repair ATPase RecF